MQLHTNEIDGSEVRREEMNGREFLVAPITPIKAMRLHKGYVPKEHVQRSAPAWNGTPLTLNHPRDSNGNLISANSPNVVETNWLGHIFNNEPNGDRTEGEAWFDLEEIDRLGGEAEQIVNELEEGNSVSVSSSYFGDPLEPGEYDGEYRDKVRGNLKPDHIAVMPNKQGVCSIDDGCMVGEPAANSESELIIEIADDSVSPEDGQDEGTIVNALEDADDDELEQMVSNPSVKDRIKSVFNWGEQSGNESAESDSDTENMNDKIEFLVNERGYDQVNLPPEDSDCFDQLYTNEQKLAELDDDEPSSNEQGPDQDNEQLDAVMNQLESMQEDMVTAEEVQETVQEEIAANEQRSEKEELADEIISNSDDWEDDDKEELLGNSKPVLESLASNVRDEELGADRRGQIPASATGGSGDDNDASDWPSPTANARVDEMESDD